MRAAAELVGQPTTTRRLRQQEQGWGRLHYARVAIIAAGFVLTLVAGTIA